MLLRSDEGYYYTLHACNGKLLCKSDPVKRKLSVLSALENNFSDFIIIDKT